VSSLLDPADPLSETLRGRIGTEITAFLQSCEPLVHDIGAEMHPLLELSTLFTAGGKRLRPAFTIWGAVAAGGLTEDPGALIRAAASLDLLHVGILVHDDVMDSSATRRGVSSAHLQFAEQHACQELLGSPDAFGRAGAILLGDLLQLWSVQMLESCGLAPEMVRQARPVLERMRTEVTCGQFLDVLVQHEPLQDAEHVLAAAGRVVEFKTAKYTVQRPVQFGAVLAGGTAELVAALEGYGSALGRAFQFRDDLLGVFGDEAATGKPAGDDLREGKRTVLIAHAYAGTTDAGRDRLRARLGDPELDADGVAELRTLIQDSGAPAVVEGMITKGFEGAIAALTAPMTEPGRLALQALALVATDRTA
jgi:geranylgeranyl diphosphate synthase type I